VSQVTKNKKLERSIANLLMPAGAIVVAVGGMFVVSISLIVLIGITLGSNFSFDAKNSLSKKNSSIVFITNSNSIESEIKKAELATPELPLHARFPPQISLSSLQFIYRN
jgi:hypothetical protein